MKTGTQRHSASAPRINRVPALIGILLLVQGCAGLNEKECRVADWRLIGYQDGVAGKSAATVGGYRRDCAEHAVVPDLEAYQSGRAEGLREYCRPDNGYRLGKAGRDIAAVCPAGLDTAFREAHAEGRAIYQARTLVNQTRTRLNESQEVLYHIEEDRRYKLTELVADGLDGRERMLVLYEISELEKEKDDVEEEIEYLEFELAEQQSQLDRLMQQASR